DLVEQLEASGVEIQNAAHKIAVPEAHARDASVAEMTKTFKALADRAVDRLMKDARKGLPSVTPETFAKTATGLAKDPDRAKRLAHWLEEEAFTGVRAAIGQRILRELCGQRRLRPDDPVGEIDVIRGLAMALTAAAGKLLPIENVQSAFSARSKMLVTRD